MKRKSAKAPMPTTYLSDADHALARIYAQNEIVGARIRKLDPEKFTALLSSTIGHVDCACDRADSIDPRCQTFGECVRASQEDCNGSGS